MLYVDTCVLLAVLLPEAHSATAAAFLEKASASLAISSSSPSVANPLPPKRET